MQNIYTIGTSTHLIDDFIIILKKYNINAIADVRSVPYSKHTPQFNKEGLKKFLTKHGINYLSFADEFGARRNEEEAYTDEKVDFKKVAKLPIFIKGIDRIDNGLQKGYNISLLCTEKNPLECHRFLLVSRTLQNSLHIGVKHILFEGNIIENENLENNMLKELNIEYDLFTNNKNILLEKAYNILSDRIAYSRKGINDE
jgi:uncharacterized protein (DUF488 family)